jgi:hypothetical protein
VEVETRPFIIGFVPLCRRAYSREGREFTVVG